MAIIACAVTLVVKSIGADNLNNLWNAKALVANFLLIFSGWPFFSMTGYNNPTWYLCVLIQCYLLFYLMICIRGKVGGKIANSAKAKQPGKLRIGTGVWCAVIVAATFVLKHFGLLQDATSRGLEAFFIGVAICEYRDVIPKKKWIPAIVVILSVALIVLAPSQQRRILLFLAFPALLLLSVWWDSSWNEKSNQIIGMLSKVSFEVYIWHYPVMAFVQMLSRTAGFEVIRTYITMAIFVVCVWLFGWLMFKFIETPINRWVRKRSL